MSAGRNLAPHMRLIESPPDRVPFSQGGLANRLWGWGGSRFRREADAAARLNNPHVIPIHTYGEIDGRLYVDMRLVEGRGLQDVLAGGSVEPGRAVRIIEQVDQRCSERVGDRRVIDVARP